jgi:hypothetical protein
MKTLFCTIILFFSLSGFILPDVTEDIANFIKAGDSKKISEYFIENIDMKILDKEDIYSKAQGELILKDFFVKHPVKSFSIVHKSTPSSKNPSLFAIGKLETSNGKFRTYFLLKKTGEKSVIQQFRIEPENE